MSYRLSQEAEIDVEKMVFDGAVLFGPDQVIEYHAKLTSRMQFLAEYPFATRLRNEVRPPVRAYPCEAHIIIYDVDDAGDVLILRVHHARQDWLDL